MVSWCLGPCRVRKGHCLLLAGWRACGFSRFVPRGSDTSPCRRWAGRSHLLGSGLQSGSHGACCPRSMDREHAGGLSCSHTLGSSCVITPCPEAGGHGGADASSSLENRRVHQRLTFTEPGPSPALHWPAQECHPLSGGWVASVSPRPGVTGLLVGVMGRHWTSKEEGRCVCRSFLVGSSPGQSEGSWHGC